ncbi:MAG: hypothetical protein AAF585_19465 [Verrucomicrobiota bacterium]
MKSESEFHDRLQLLVDGQLSGDEREELFTELDQQESEEWRSLALAYVEAQTLREAFAKLEPAPMQSPAPKKAQNPAIHVYAAAAAIAFAFLAGFQLRSTVTNAPDSSGPAVAAAEAVAVPAFLTAAGSAPVACYGDQLVHLSNQ